MTQRTARRRFELSFCPHLPLGATDSMIEREGALQRRRSRARWPLARRQPEEETLEHGTRTCRECASSSTAAAWRSHPGAGHQPRTVRHSTCPADAHRMEQRLDAQEMSAGQTAAHGSTVLHARRHPAHRARQACDVGSNRLRPHSPSPLFSVASMLQCRKDCRCLCCPPADLSLRGARELAAPLDGCGGPSRSGAPPSPSPFGAPVLAMRCLGCAPSIPTLAPTSAPLAAPLAHRAPNPAHCHHRQRERRGEGGARSAHTLVAAAASHTHIHSFSCSSCPSPRCLSSSALARFASAPPAESGISSR